jgi:histidyl-tRNA synthetase
MKDVLPSDSAKWQYIEDNIRKICARNGFFEVRTPILEHSELFLRGVGETTDIVQKEMYTFTDKGERSVTLKPEGTAGVVRMFCEHNLGYEPQPVKMYYLNSPIFRYENPQAGRLREHHQFGVEVFGAKLAAADAECIALVFELLTTLGVTDLSVSINSIGCKKCRPTYNAKLKEYLQAKEDSLCGTCKTRLQQNPLRILDCKVPTCKEVCACAPKTTDCLCEECENHFNELKTFLCEMEIKYNVNPLIVRGLDYYTKTVFEVVSTALGSQDAVCGGGRYDDLVSELGGPETPAVGFGMGMERLIMMLENLGVELPTQQKIDVYIASVGDKALLASIKLAYELRKQGIYAEFDHVGRSIKAQFKYADKAGAKSVIVIGENELENGIFKLKNMADGNEVEINFNSAVEQIKTNFEV